MKTLNRHRKGGVALNTETIYDMPVIKVLYFSATTPFLFHNRI